MAMINSKTCLPYTDKEWEEYLDEVHRKSSIHPQYVIDDIHRFRDKMGLRSSDLDELQELFATLMGCWVMARSTKQHPDATKKELDMMDMAFECLKAEWSKRFVLLVMGQRYSYKK